MESAFVWIGSWLVLAIVVAIVAAARGRSGFGWFFIALLISPIISFIVLALLGRTAEPASPEPFRRMRRCPFCAEDILAEAVRCKHCGSDIPPPPPRDKETDEEVAIRFGIRRDSGQYIYGAYRYTELSEAIAIARKEHGEA